MKKKELKLKDASFSLVVVCVAFIASLFIKYIFNTQSLIPMIFVMGVFQISLNTQGYFWGVTASLVSVLAVNYAFTFPYYAFDLITPENFFSAVVMLVVAIATGTLTTKIKVQEKIEAEIEKERMRANLLRAISHDLRTPLTSIYGASTTVIDHYDALTKAQQLKLLGEVQNDAQWLIRMVENLLSVTRIDGNGQISKQPVVLEELIDSVVTKFRKHNAVSILEVEIPEEFVMVPMDVMLIQQVLLNLLENAVYHAVGMTQLRLLVTLEEDRVVFVIRDNGCGILEDRMDGLFSGYRASDTMPTDGSRHNMGIGLSVCAAIVKAHGGQIYAENNPEGGASFAFWLNVGEENE